MLTLRIDNETEEMIAYLRLHNIKYTTKIKQSIKHDLKELCAEFKRKEKKN